MSDPVEREEKRLQEQAPVEEAGGGESEGFEQAEQRLIDQAEGNTPRGGGGHPLGDAMPVEADPLAGNTIHGEADQVASSEDVDEAETDQPETP